MALPPVSWTPDGRSIVIWGEGKIWKVDAATGKGQQVPFAAPVDLTINAALRFPQKVHPDEFPVRMLRDVRVSPDGRLVVYSALGHLYTRRLPDGQPQRLTKTDRLESFRLFSRWRVERLHHWTDEELGACGLRPDAAAGATSSPGPDTTSSRPSLRRAEDCFRHARRPVRGRTFQTNRASTLSPQRRRKILVRDGGADPSRPHGDTNLSPGCAQREIHAVQRGCAHVGLAVPGATRSNMSAATTPRSTPLARRKVAGVRGALKTFIAPFPRTGGRWRSVQPRNRIRSARLTRRGLLSPLVGRQPRLHWSLGQSCHPRAALTFAVVEGGTEGGRTGPGVHVASPRRATGPTEQSR